MSAEELISVRRDWRDTVRVAADLALLGLLVSVAALPVVTAGAAVATGSAAVHYYLEHDRWPEPRFCARVFRRWLLPGLAAMLACVAAAVLVVVDLRAFSGGRVPGGTPLMVVTVVVTLAAAGYLGLLVVAAGAGRGSILRVPLERSTGTGRVHADIGLPTVAAMAGVIALAGLLVVLVHPVLVAVLIGYTIFALHVVARRWPAGPV